MRTVLMIAVAVLAAVPVARVAGAQSARAEVRDADGKPVGTATLTQKGDDVHIVGIFSGLPPGTRAFHLHEVGKCEPPFESAGAHFNPAGKQHGKDNPQGQHAGDLLNITVPPSGQAKVDATARGVSLGSGNNGLLDADGTALVVHEGADDYTSDPAGNAGKRIACGVVRR